MLLAGRFRVQYNEITMVLRGTRPERGDVRVSHRGLSVLLRGRPRCHLRSTLLDLKRRTKRDRR